MLVGSRTFQSYSSLHNLAMPYVASNDWAHNHVLPQDVQLNLAMLCLATNDRGPAPAFSFWPWMRIETFVCGAKQDFVQTFGVQSKTVYSFWPCLACKWWPRGSTSMSTQSGHASLCKHCARGGYSIVYSIWPWLAGQALTKGQGQATCVRCEARILFKHFGHEARLLFK